MSELRPKDQNDYGFEPVRGPFQAYWNPDKDDSNFILIENCLMTDTIPATATRIKTLANSKPELPDIDEDTTIITLYLRDVKEFKNESKERTASGSRIFFVYRISDTGQKITTPYSLRIRKEAFFYYQKQKGGSLIGDQFKNLANVPQPVELAIRSSSQRSGHNTSIPGDSTKAIIRLYPPTS